VCCVITSVALILFVQATINELRAAAAASDAATLVLLASLETSASKMAQLLHVINSVIVGELEQAADPAPPAECHLHATIAELKAKLAELERCPPKVVEKRKRKRDVLEPGDIEYIKSVKNIQDDFRSSLETDKWGALKSKQMQLGFLIELLDELKVEYSSDESAKFQLIDVSSVAKSMLPSYNSADVFNDHSKAIRFLRRDTPSTSDRRMQKKHYVDGYMAFLRIMGEPFVARNLDCCS